MFSKRNRSKKSMLMLIFVGYLLFYLYNSIRRNQLNSETKDDRSLKPVYSYPTDHIHVAYVCAGSQYSKLAIASIKSMLFHRRKQYMLTLHIFTDKIGRQMIKNLFSNRSEKSCINIKFYQIAKLLQTGEKFLEEHNLNVTHYSGIYAFSKTFIHEYLSSNISHVMMVDTDILFLDDIYSTWDEFRRFQPSKTLVGLVPWYPPLPTYFHYNGSTPDPYLTGIVLIDLQFARAMNFTPLLSQITKYASVRFGLRSLWTADQVIFSLFATYMPEYIVSLPCYNNAHTLHHLKKESDWRTACGETYPRNVHVVPANRLKRVNDYYGHLFSVFDEMPIDWLWFCIDE